MAGPRQSADIGGPLRGIRVLDFSRLAPGPYGSMLLADLGADVIRVERVPLGSDMPRNGDVVGRGKRSVGLNLKDPDGVEAALRILESCDVLLEGFRPGVMERLGLGPDEVASRNPRVVYARMTGWGQESPIRDRAGHDINYIAVSGALNAIGRAGGPPIVPLNLLGDFGGGGMLLAFGVLAGVLEGRRTGTGQVIDAAMVDGVAALLSPAHASLHAGAWNSERGTNLLDSGAPFYDVYETADGRWVAVGALEPQFYRILLPELGLDPADCPPQYDQSSWPLMRKRFAEIFIGRTRDEWATTFAGLDACVSPVLALDEAPADEHASQRQAYVAANGRLQPAPVPRFSRTPGRIGGPSPSAGEHSRAVLRDWLGLDDSALAARLASGAVHGSRADSVPT
jgi:alpha-methylacyl-CoA racemase